MSDKSLFAAPSGTVVTTDNLSTKTFSTTTDDPLESQTRKRSTSNAIETPEEDLVCDEESDKYLNGNGTIPSKNSRKRRKLKEKRKLKKAEALKPEFSQLVKELMALQPLRDVFDDNCGGFVNLDKPTAVTSHDAVLVARRLLRTKSIGHGGTLDPGATGVLPLAIGRATRLLQYLPADKAYTCTIRLGMTTDSHDMDGAVLTCEPAPHITREAVAHALKTFVGKIMQRPPAFSAIWVDGKRAHELAREGKEIPQLKAREVHIYELRLDAFRPGQFPEVDVSVWCGPGTYVRCLARDVGDLLSCGGTITALRRIISHGFDEVTSLCSLRDMHSVDFKVLPAHVPFGHLRAVRIPTQNDEALWRLGRLITVKPECIEDATKKTMGADGCEVEQEEVVTAGLADHSTSSQKKKHKVGELVKVFGVEEGGGMLGLGRMTREEPLPSGTGTSSSGVVTSASSLSYKIGHELVLAPLKGSIGVGKLVDARTRWTGKNSVEREFVVEKEEEERVVGEKEEER